MANERVRGHDLGPTGATIAANVARTRKAQQLSLQDLEGRLTRLGRRISFSGISKIERGERRVDGDDLMALAIALDVSPLALLLPLDDPDASVEVTGAKGSLGLFWPWALGERTPFSRDDRAFVARSLPWWLEGGADMRWYGHLELEVAVGSDEPEVVETHFFTAKKPSDVAWDRTRDDGVDQTTS